MLIHVHMTDALSNAGAVKMSREANRQLKKRIPRTAASLLRCLTRWPPLAWAPPPFPPRSPHNISRCAVVCRSVHPCVCLSVCQPPHDLFFSPSFCPSMCLSIHGSVCLSVCLSVCPSVCLSVCLYTCVSLCLSVYQPPHSLMHTKLGLTCFAAQASVCASLCKVIIA